MRIRPRSALLVAALLTGLGIAPLTAPHVATGATTVGPKAYYLALGDSLAYGFQPTNFISHTVDNNNGYADDFAAYLHDNYGLITTTNYVNYGCPQETTTSFIHGFSVLFPCFDLLLGLIPGVGIGYKPGDPYYVSQLYSAVKFINAHPGQVSPVTLDIGANDFLSVFQQVGNLATCTITASATTTATIQAGLRTISNNLSGILYSLTKALHGTGDVMVMTYYNPLEKLCQNNPQALTYYQLLNALISKVATAYNAIVVDGSGPNADLCADTWMCESPPLPLELAIHATDAGYRLIAQSFEQVPGYNHGTS